MYDVHKIFYFGTLVRKNNLYVVINFFVFYNITVTVLCL